MDYLCLVHDDIYFFQKIRPSQLLQAKRISFGESFTYDENSMSIVINTYADAMYVKDCDRLYFQKLETISSILKELKYCFVKLQRRRQNYSYKVILFLWELK